MTPSTVMSVLTINITLPPCLFFLFLLHTFYFPSPVLNTSISLLNLVSVSPIMSGFFSFTYSSNSHLADINPSAVVYATFSSFPHSPLASDTTSVISDSSPSSKKTLFLPLYLFNFSLWLHLSFL